MHLADRDRTAGVDEVDIDYPESESLVASHELAKQTHVDADMGTNLDSEPGINLAVPYERSPPPVSSPRSVGVPRKRKLKATQFTVGSPARKNNSRNRNIKESAGPLVTNEQVKGAIQEGASHTASYALDIFSRAMYYLRRPFGILFAAYLFAFVFSWVSAKFTPLLTPLCYVPIVSRSPLCYIGKQKVPRWADYPKLVEVQSSTFEQLLDQSVGGQGLALDVKKAEMATSDLVTLVRVSDLKSKDLLARTLEDFVSDAKRTGRGLQRLSAKIGGAVDSILAVNDHALHTIEAATRKSAIGHYLWPLSPTIATKEVITKTFTDAMSVLSTQMERVILEAEVSITNLDRLEQRLITLHELVTREDATFAIEKSELLAQLWTMLGGNRKELNGIDKHLFLLRNIGQYRIRALAHVTAALHALEGMSADMEDLRERVAAPDVVGERVPVEVHMKTIKAGLDRLTEKRLSSREREERVIMKMLGIEEESD